MKKKFRVKRNEDFQSIISKRQSFACKEFVIYVAKNNCSYGRVGISVSKKLGNAVVRNKIKRQVREMVYKTVNFEEGYDYVVIVRHAYLNKSFEENLASLQFVYRRVIKKYLKKETSNENKQS